MASPVATPIRTIAAVSSVISVRTVSIISLRKVGIAIIAVRTIAVAESIMRISVPVVTVTWADVDINLCGRFRWRNRQSKGGGTHNHSQRIFHRLAPFGETLRG